MNEGFYISNQAAGIICVIVGAVITLFWLYTKSLIKNGNDHKEREQKTTEALNHNTTALNGILELFKEFKVK